MYIDSSFKRRDIKWRHKKNASISLQKLVTTKDFFF